MTPPGAECIRLIECEFFLVPLCSECSSKYTPFFFFGWKAFFANFVDGLTRMPRFTFIVIFSFPIVNSNCQFSHTPCTYPSPDSSEFAKCSSYLNFSFICDPNGIISKTDAEPIGLLLSKNYSNCFSSDHQCNSIKNRLNIGLALIDKGGGCKHTVRLSDCGTSPSQYQEIQFWDRPLGAMFAESLREKWSWKSCETDVMLLAVKWMSDSTCSGAIRYQNRVFIALSKRAEVHFLTSGRFDVLQYIYDHNDIIDSEFNSLLDELTGVSANLTSSRSDKSKSVVPTWAIYTFVGCCLMTGLLVLLGHLVNGCPTLSSIFNPGKTLRGIWRAGYAGGVWIGAIQLRTASNQNTDMSEIREKENQSAEIQLLL